MDLSGMNSGRHKKPGNTGAQNRKVGKVCSTSMHIKHTHIKMELKKLKMAKMKSKSELQTRRTTRKRGEICWHIKKGRCSPVGTYCEPRHQLPKITLIQVLLSKTLWNQKKEETRQLLAGTYGGKINDNVCKRAKWSKGLFKKDDTMNLQPKNC